MSLMNRRSMLGWSGAAAVAGCGNWSQPGLTWWAIGSTGESAPLLISDFSKRSGIAVDVQAVPWTGAHEKLLTAYAGNSLPDVMMLSSAWLPEMALIGALAPPPRHGHLFNDQFFGALTAVTVDGRVVAAPWTADSWMQFYRRDLLAEVGYDAPPLGWKEWTHMALQIRQRHPDRYATFHPLDWPEPLFAFAAQQPEPLLRDRSSRGNFSSPGFRAALSFYKSIYDQRLAPRVTYAEIGDPYVALHRGLFAILPSSSVSIGDLRRRSDVFPQQNWGVVATPGVAGRGKAIAQGASLAVSHSTRDPRNAWVLVDYLCDAATQRRLYGITGDLPTRPSAWSHSDLAHDPVSRAFADQIGNSIAPPAVPEWARIIGDVQLVAEHMVRGEFSVEAATIEMDRRVDRILRKRRWLLDRGSIA